MMQRKRWRLCCALFAAFACAFFGWKIIRLNQNYPQQVIRQVPAGEDGELQDGVTLRVIKAHWRTKDEAKKLYGKAFSDEMDDEDTYRVMEVEVEVSSHSEQDQDVFLHDLYLEKGAYEQGLAPEIFYSVNHDQDMDFKLRAHETRNITLGYVLFDVQFQKSHWNRLESLGFYLADTKYPVKTEWLL